MMHSPNTRTLRLILPAVYLLAVIAFCSVSAWLAVRHFQCAENGADNLAGRLEAVSNCRAMLDHAVHAFFGLASKDRSPAAADEMYRRSVDLGNAASRLAELIPDDPVCTEFSASSARIAERAEALLTQKNESAAFELEPMLSSASDTFRIIEKTTVSESVALARPDDDFFSRTLLSSEIFVILFALLLLAGYAAVSRQFRKALTTLSDGTKELRSGNLDYRFREITPDEIGQVKYDFNMMARRIEKQSDELKSANTELRDQAEKLIEAHQHKDRFLSNMSHELRTPLNSIIGFSELIEARSENLPKEKLKSYTTRILTAANHLLSLITALLDLAKSGAGTLKAVPVDFDLSAAISEMCEMLAPLAAKKNLQFRQEIEPDLHLTADPRMIRQIFINLFGNAVKYTFDGFVAVRLENTPEACLMEVEDSGMGIPEKEQKNLFRDFYRTESASRQIVDGAGIGLALSRRLAELNGGSIRFASTEGKGSVFTLVLPHAEKRVAPQETQA